MSRKDYVAIAKILNERMPESPAAERIAQDMADLFAKDNPRFDRERFLKACGVTNGQ